MNEITIFEGRKIDKIAKSGNARLDKISNEIMSEMNKANALFTEVQAKTEAYARACAPLFGEVKRDKLYEKGGYKSLEEYAAVFGVQKSTAYAWARVGEAFFLDDNDYTRKIRETLTMSNMAELTNTDRVQLAAAIDNKDITKDTAQKDIREFATSHRKDGKNKERVLPTFTVAEMSSKAVIVENAIKEDMYEAVAQSLVDMGVTDSTAAVFFSTAKLDGDKPSAAQHFIAYTAAGYVKMYEYRPYVAKKADTKGKGKDISSLKDMLAAMSPAERLELLKALDGTEE